MVDAKFILLALIFLASNVVEAITGFGATIIAVTLGANFYPIEYLVPVLVPVNIVLSSYIVVRYYSAVDREVFFRVMLPLAGIGLVVGSMIFNFAESRSLKLAYGIFVFSFSIYELARILRTKEDIRLPELSMFKSALWLISGGIIQGIYASGGPLVVYYARRKLRNKLTFRSTMSSLWLVLNIYLFINHVATEKATVETLMTSAKLIPSIVIGIAVGEVIHHRIRERTFKIFVFALLIVAGASLLLRA